MSTVITICNMALARIGVSSYISSLTEASNEARNCALFYEPMRDFVLRDHPWNFAKKRVRLADAGTPPPEWGFKYAYPSDCIKVRHIVSPGFINPRNDQRVQYEVAHENGQRVIYSNQDQAELVYTMRVTDPTIYDPMFTSALAYLLASEIAMPLSVQPAVADQARKAYSQTVSMASAATQSESFEGPEPVSELITTRDGYSGPVNVFTQDY
jgi:hypothetical protein